MGRDSVRRRRAANATGCSPAWFVTSTLVKSNDAVVGRDPSTASDDWITPSRVTTGRASTDGRLVGTGSRCAVRLGRARPPATCARTTGFTLSASSRNRVLETSSRHRCRSAELRRVLGVVGRLRV